MKKTLFNIFVLVFFLSGCQSLRTALKIDPHVSEHRIAKAIESSSDKHLVHVFVDHKWSKEKEGHYINVSGYVRDPQAKSFLHDVGLFKKDPNNINKSLDSVYVQATFLDDKDQVISQKRVKVQKKYVLHGSHSHRSKFSLQVDDDRNIAKCVLSIDWS